MEDARVGRWTFGTLRKETEPTGEGLELVTQGNNHGLGVHRATIAVTDATLLGYPLGDSSLARYASCGGASLPIQAVTALLVVGVITTFAVFAASGWDFDFSDTNATSATA